MGEEGEFRRTPRLRADGLILLLDRGIHMPKVISVGFIQQEMGCNHRTLRLHLSG